MAIKLYASCRGDGPNVILLHGLFGSGSNLGGVARELESAFSVCSVDLPNHGRSEWLDAPDLGSMADCLLAWMEARGIDSAHLLGHSLGGKVAMQLALQAPERIASLAVADIAPVAYRGRHDSVFAALDAVATARCHTREEAFAVMAQFVEEEGVIQFLMKSLQRDAEGVLRWRLDLHGLRKAYSELIAAPDAGSSYTGPVLFIKGAGSDYIKQSHWEGIVTLFPAAKIKVMADCGHWLHAQKPALFNSIVARFLEDQVASGASSA